MRIVIAADSFKETLSSKEVGEAISTGLKRSIPSSTITVRPMADGGEGTLAALIDASHGKYIYKNVTGPLGNSLEAVYGISGNEKEAFIEIASASGIHLTNKKSKDINIATTYGTGELILDALNKGIRSFIIGIGGSGTNDGGAGMLQALGASFLDSSGKELSFGGSSLKQLARIDRTNFDKRIENSFFRIACDVDNPLTGELGASAVYGPQKGAVPADVINLDLALAHYAGMVKSTFGIEIDNIPGAGAAGGMGAAFLGFFPARLEKGAVIVSEVTKLKSYLEQADLVITGEGGINNQSIFGKTPVYVAQLTKAVSPSIPVIAVCGSIGENYEAVFDAGIDAVFSTISEITSFEELKKNSGNNVVQTAENIGRLIQLNIHG
ncbi:glycerate kinase [Alkalicoccus daliensis]|uniref:Glycerate kinase n=1 Tax=Alkalicoccus daliensis TaxID=745820 RepID=A0A1H0DPV8_9BACI|nr:glycerate kinase [Alkalicoccus daliensis]SDN72099.1 glycerate kinase [Alkalicoccus daliensis]